MAVIFLFAPLGFILGFVIGLIAALRARWSGFTGFIKTQGLSILVTIAIAAGVSGFFWLAADKLPKIDGKELALDFELKIPPAIQLPAELTDYSVYASFYANNKENRVASINVKSITKRMVM